MTRNTPIRRKLMSIIMLTTSVALLLTCASFFAYELLTFKENAARKLSTQGEIIAANSTAALAFDNQADAQEILRALKAEKHIVAAALYDKNGKLFCKYPANLSDSAFPTQPAADGFLFRDSHFMGFTPVIQGKNDRLGTLYIKSDMGATLDRLRLYGVISCLAILLSLGVAYVISVALQKQISRPILSLAGVAKAVSDRGDYSVRASKLGEGELGLLTDAFNQMLGRIQDQNRELVESEERFREVLENVDLIAITLDLDANITFCNDYLLKMTGWTREEALGSGWLEKFVPPAELPSVKPMFEDMNGGAIPSHCETSIWTKSKELREIAWSNTMLRDTAGRVIGVASIGEDITDRKKLQGQLLQSQKMESLGSLAGGVAHDFNNLLTGMLGYAELAQMSLPNDSPIQADLVEIQKAAERGANLTRQLLTFARKEVVEPQIVDLNQLTSGLEGLIRKLIGVNIELVILKAPDLGKVKVDPAQFEQVVMNLAINARDAMDGHGKLIIESQNVVFDEAQLMCHDELQPGSYVALAVTDTGSGMSKEVQAQAFDPFFTTKPKGKGTGLGLSTCYGILRNNGGRISIYSEINQGTTFRTYFPRIDSEAVLSEAEVAPDAICRGETILIVEDEDSVRSLVVNVLSRIGHKMLQAANADEALKLVEGYKEPIELIVTDMIMPGRTGRELADVLDTVRPDSKVLFISGYTDDAIVHNGLLKNNLSYLQKPFTSRALARKVREILDQTPSEIAA